MSRYDMPGCEEKHTCLFPGKDVVRQAMIEKCNPKAGGAAITISQAAFGMFRTLGWKGLIKPCDINPITRQSIHGCRGMFPTLKIMSPGNSIEETIDGCSTFFLTKELVLVDLDLAGKVPYCRPILVYVVTALLKAGVCCKVFLTFRNGRDEFGKDATWNRIHFLRKALPPGVKYVSHTTYGSDWVDEHAKHHKGSAMCIVEFQVNPAFAKSKVLLVQEFVKVHEGRYSVQACVKILNTKFAGMGDFSSAIKNCCSPSSNARTRCENINGKLYIRDSKKAQAAK